MDTIKRDRMVRMTDTGTGQSGTAAQRKPIGFAAQRIVKAPKTAVETVKKTVKKAAEQRQVLLILFQILLLSQ